MRKLLFVILLLAGVFIGACSESESQLLVIDESGKIDLQRLKARAIEIVRDGLAGENAFVRDRAIKVVSLTGTNQLMRTVTQLLNDDVVVVRFAAAEAIGDVRYAAGEYGLRRLLSDRNDNIKIAAAYALTRLGKGDFSGIIRRLTKSKDQTVRANAAMLLGKLGNKKDIKLLYEVISDSDSRDWVKIETVKAIARLGDEKIYRSKCWPLLISKYADDRIMGVKAMGELGTTDAKNAIKTMLYDDIMEVRLYAAGQLGQLGDTAGEVEVLTYLNEQLGGADEWSVANETAVTAIGQIGTNELVRFLPRFMNSRNKLIRLSGAQSALLLVQ
jgi:HEAT repeat protein